MELKYPFGIQHRRLSKLLQSLNFTLLKGKAFCFLEISEDSPSDEFEIDLAAESCLRCLPPETTADELSRVLKTSGQTGSELKFLSLTDESLNKNSTEFSNA